MLGCRVLRAFSITAFGCGKERSLGLSCACEQTELPRMAKIPQIVPAKEMLRYGVRQVTGFAPVHPAVSTRAGLREFQHRANRVSKLQRAPPFRSLMFAA